MNAVTEMHGTIGPRRTLHSGPAITIGRFACCPGCAEFASPGRIPVSQVIFPERPVRVRRENAPTCLVDPTMAAIYRCGEEYEREPVGRFEDRHYWIGYRANLAESMSDRDVPGFVWRTPFFREQRRFFQALESGRVSDPLEVEERALALIDGVLSSASPPRASDAARYGRVSRDLIEAVKERIAAAPEERATLTRLADAFGVSPFSLFRAFRAMTGWTVHRYATEVRLRLAWSLLADTAKPITDIALDTGFSSHSHFTASFRRRFGLAPNRHPARG